LVGALVDLTSWGSLLLYAAIFAAAALALLLRIPAPPADSVLAD
jgi:hypothetical protein